MVEAPNEENTYNSDEDPIFIYNIQPVFCKDQRDSKRGLKAIWWNNKKYQRLWYWHNDQWNRAI